MKARSIVLWELRASHVTVPGGRIRSSPAVSVTLISRSAAVCCVRHVVPPHLGWCRLKSPSTRWPDVGSSASYVSSSSIAGVSTAV